MSDQSDAEIDLQHEMMMRGFNEILEERGPRREYAEAYDSFLEKHGLDGRVGNRPDNVQEAFKELLGEYDAD